MRDFCTIDLFAGAGGLTLGFHQGGFTPLAATDFDESASKTFELNFPRTPFLLRPISDIGGEDLLNVAGVNRGEVDVLLGGPPCQAFSVYNHQRGFHDDRSGLFREYLRIVEAVSPKIVVIENVTGMTSLGDGKAVDEISSKLEELGYVVDHKILRAEEYGVPQERRRVIFLASRVGSLCWPQPTHVFDSQLVTVGSAIGDLPELEMGCGSDSLVPYSKAATTDFQRAMRTGSAGVSNHFAPQLGDINIQRIQHIPQGGSWRDIPTNLLPPGMRQARRSDHTKRYGRLSPNGLFSTILTKADLHWGAYIHPTQDRTLTVRECARAQSFPDRFVFLGSRGDQYKQVGNAVPPILAAAVASAVARMLENSAARRTFVGKEAQATG